MYDKWIETTPAYQSSAEREMFSTDLPYAVRALTYDIQRRIFDSCGCQKPNYTVSETRKKNK